MPHNQDGVGGARELSKHRLIVAQEDLETAEFNFRENHFRAANNRAYYAIYHGITAVLALDGIAFKRHKDTVAHFNKEYVKTKIFPRELGRRISRAEEIRHASDYDEFYVVSRTETEEQIETARFFLLAVSNYLQQKSNELMSDSPFV